MLNRQKVLKTVVFFLLIFTLTACNSSTSGSLTALKKGETYYGKNATFEMIEVNSNDSWTIKSKDLDDSNYTVVSVEDTGEKVDKYPVIELKATETKGDIDSRFAKKEGRKFIIVKDENEVYFRSVSESNISGIEEKLKKESDKDELIKSISNYIFARK
ncbi:MULTISPECIES: hypothetical protein [Bacillati]|uniref:hypothetical protein n=1 Tax=Bacillati TaxID=1783272 RepID=UPI0035D747CF